MLTLFEQHIAESQLKVRPHENALFEPSCGLEAIPLLLLSIFILEPEKSLLNGEVEIAARNCSSPHDLPIRRSDL
jgi:hypothetical protein